MDERKQTGMSRDQMFAFWGWAYALAFDLEWEAYKAGQEGGSGYRRYRLGRAAQIHATTNAVMKPIPDVREAPFDEVRYARLSIGLSREGAAQTSQFLRLSEANWNTPLDPGDDEDQVDAVRWVLQRAVPRFHQLLGISAEAMATVLPVAVHQKALPATGPVPWDERGAPEGLGHIPTVRFWCWLSSIADTDERRLVGDRHLSAQARPLMRTKLRVLRQTLRDLWEALPAGEWQDEAYATWQGLTRGLSLERAQELELRLRQSAVDHAARNGPTDLHASEVYAQAAGVLGGCFGLDARTMLPTSSPRPPRSLDWVGWLCEPGCMIWDTTAVPTRADFIQRIERGSLR